jgi:ribosomal protein S10
MNVNGAAYPKVIAITQGQEQKPAQQNRKKTLRRARQNSKEKAKWKINIHNRRFQCQNTEKT